MTNMPNFNKLDQAIIYLIDRLHSLTRTKLVKFLYLTDISHYKKFKKPLTNVKYYSYHYGPFSEEVLKSIEKLNPYEIEELHRISNEGREYYTYSLGRNSRIGELDLTRGEKQCLDQVTDTYGKMDLDDLLKHVYNTSQYRNCKKGQTIDLSLND